MREGQGHPAFGDLRQDRRFLRLAAGQAQSGPTQHYRRQIRFERQHPAKRLHHQHDLDGAGAKAAMLLCKRQTEEPLLGVARPQRGAPTLGLGEIAASLCKAVMVGEQPVD